MTMRHAAGGAGQIDEPERGTDEAALDDSPGLPRPDAGAPEGGAPAAIEGTSLAGPVGGTVGAMADGSLGPEAADRSRVRADEDAAAERDERS